MCENGGVIGSRGAVSRGRLRAADSTTGQSGVRAAVRALLGRNADGLVQGAPSRLRIGRQFIHVFEEERHLPELRLVEDLPETRHRSPTNAVLHFPVRCALSIVLDAVLCE